MSLHLPSNRCLLTSPVAIDGSSNSAAARGAVGEVFVNISMFVSRTNCVPGTAATAVYVPASERHKTHKTQSLPKSQSLAKLVILSW